ncbi:MAG: hypothetical protein ACLTS9_02405 [Sutterella wadsworthensis]
MKDHVCASVKLMTDCERTDIPFGFYESDTAETVDPLKAADGKKESSFTVQDAVVRMFDLDEATLWRDEWNGKAFFRFERAPAAAEDALMRSVERDPKAFCYRFMGEESPNPFNCGDAEDARFSRSAFYRWWKENPNGLLSPKWFDDLRRADELKPIDANQFPVECVAELSEGPEDVPPPDERWVIEHMCECREVEPQQTVPSAAPFVAPCIEGAGVDLSEGPKGVALPDDYEIAPGVTVGHIRALFDQGGERYSPELAAAVWVWSSFEDCPDVAAGCTVKEEIKSGRLSDWEGPPLSVTGRERVAVLVNWNKTPAKH